MVEEKMIYSIEIDIKGVGDMEIMSIGFTNL